MNAAEYHAHPALSAGVLKQVILRSPLHAWTQCRWLNPDFREEVKDEYDLGTVVHSLVLEGSEAGLVLVEANDWRTNAAKALREEARSAGKIAILAHKMPRIRAIAAAARETVERSELAGIFAGGMPEHTIIWLAGGTPCKARLDLLAEDATIILDLKTTANAEPNAFIRQITSLGYDTQAEFYTRAVMAQYKVPFRPAFVFLAVETEPPYACSLVALGPQMQEIAARKVDQALAIWDACQRSGKWPAYSTQIHYAEPTPWDAAKWLETEEAGA